MKIFVNVGAKEFEAIIIERKYFQRREAFIIF
jgi:hypothetical protein